jgi:Ni,Fe-hydrogenase III large subunit
MMDAIIPGGIASDIAEGGADAIAIVLDTLQTELPTLTRLYDDTSSLVDRMQGTGTLTPDRAARFAAGGVIGRASARRFDARRIPGYAPYDRLDVTIPQFDHGDVDARVRVRLAELAESTRLLRLLLESVPEGPVALPLPMATGEGIGWSEGFRGDIWHWLRLEGGLITAAFLADPSWRQWPLLEVAIAGNIVADFPLCNKSFNCSYSGVDL